MYQLEEIRQITTKMYLLFDDPIAQVAKQSGKSRPTVSKFFNLKAIRPSSAEHIYDACLKLVEEKENQRQSRLKKGRQLKDSMEITPQTSMNL
ncbi:hypothetical protein EM932_06020 [Flavivirga rizhaonensis]|uniref:Uncharacterized protein n=2 Tax=Flavivirga rizhaonensis TaxID=2559571 RepID=A0A4S1DZQ9_9FLAO|nr:hypothetical protein EM932_06020 [Flavivirga rizhaonensis]